MKIRCAIALAGVVGGLSAAHAGTVTARYSGSYAQAVDVTLTPTVNGSINTVTFNWVRTDVPGPGVDSTIDGSFIAYCCEIGQTVSGNTDYTYTVQTAAEHGFSANQEMLLGRLWSGYKTGVNSPTTSAAFQMAVWELSFDTGADLETGLFLGNGGPAIVALAQSYLDSITSPSYNGGQHEIRVLHHPSAQDQLIPTPGSIALLGLGGLAVGRRRR
ncbi:MAG: Cys-Gln thioester bond-forming surface protein [Planctomycetota bacterium]|nr:Cys-Gln thioester bond-forming surface protein [Planctomycetota bacterium]